MIDGPPQGQGRGFAGVDMAAIIRHFRGLGERDLHAGSRQMRGRSFICADLLPKINELLIKWAEKIFVPGLL
jgi:hypothetical protein